MPKITLPAKRIRDFALEHQLETKTFALDKPIKVGGEEISELVVREPIAYDLESAIDGEASVKLLVDSMCGVAEGELRYMRLKEYDEIQDWVLSFLPDTQ